MVEQAKCVGGDHPTNAQGITLCHHCVQELETDLRSVPEIWGDLQTTAARQDVGAQSHGTTGHSTPSEPCNFNALDKGQTLGTILTGWAQHLDPTQHGTPEQMAGYLTLNLKDIRRQEWAGILKDELREALNECRRATDRAADRISLGRCVAGCPGIMTAIVGARTARCKLCGTTGDARALQRWIIAEAWHVAAYLPLILRALKQGGHAAVKIDTADKWVERKKLEPVACDVASRRCLYTAADVLNTYHETPTGRRELQAEMLDTITY